MTRQQEYAVEELALQHGRACVQDGYADQVVRVTVPGGAHFHIHDDDDATIREAGIDFSVDWAKGEPR